MGGIVALRAGDGEKFYGARPSALKFFELRYSLAFSFAS
jgi:hypothetical protein